MQTYDRTLDLPFVCRVAETEDEDTDIGEIAIAEYLVFLFALDTYMRWIEEIVKIDPTAEEAKLDVHTSRGLSLLRRADKISFAALNDLLRKHITNPSSLKMLEVVMRMPPTARGASVRTLRLRTIMSRGGTTTTRAVFDVPRARREVLDAIEASMTENADVALSKFAAIQMRNKLLDTWIDKASEIAYSGIAPEVSPVLEASKRTTDYKKTLTESNLVKEGSDPASEIVASEVAKQQTVLKKIEEDAKAAAQKSMAKAQEEDSILTKSETIAVATAVVAAAAAEEVPVSLKGLDPEQRAAALTDGRVIVAASAGSGKSHTAVSRVAYLVKERGANPTKIMVMSFNRKAANELRYKIGKAVGDDTLKSMSVGTTHSIFRNLVVKFGNKEEVGALTGNQVSEAALAGSVNRAWAECFPNEEQPRAKDMMRYKSVWAGDGLTPAQAREQASSPREQMAALWYEFYMGFKGAIPNWKPPCSKVPFAWNKFNARYRSKGQRLADFDDMLGMLRDILKRDPSVRKSIQKMFDHIIVDEAQDQNATQLDIIDMISEHITDGSDGKSLWLVGDDIQSIYGFRGARPKLFIDLYGKEGWKSRTIRTNYRCAPEIVELANKLISHNEGQIPKEAMADPTKVRGMASVRVLKPEDEAVAAIATAVEIKGDMQSGGSVSDYAVLTRTNREQHAFETACIIKGIPYARRGASSFLGSPETTAVLSYVQLVTGDDAQKMQIALEKVINNPNRFFIGPEKASSSVKDALSAYARRMRIDIKVCNPLTALADRGFREDLASKLLGMDIHQFKVKKAIERIEDLYRQLSEMQANCSDPEYKTADLFTDILSTKGVAVITDPKTGRVEWGDQTFLQSLQADVRNSIGDSEDEDAADLEEEDSKLKGLGNIGFLYELAKVDPDDASDALNDPSKPNGFKAKIERYASRMRDLRIDTTKWDKEQEQLPIEKRSPPPGVYLGTCHSTKGAQWKNCYVVMPHGKFPLEPKPRPGDAPMSEEELKEQRQQERRLAYVALTRPKQNLTIICPDSVDGKGAGISDFVGEAGLSVGENVKRPEGMTKEAATVDDWSKLKRGTFVEADIAVDSEVL